MYVEATPASKPSSPFCKRCQIKERDVFNWSRHPAWAETTAAAAALAAGMRVTSAQL